MTTNQETSLAKLIGAGASLNYQHHHTMGSEVHHHSHQLTLPADLATLADEHPDAEVSSDGGSLGIFIKGRLWAHEDADLMHPEETGIRKMTSAFWQYLKIAMGLEIDGIQFGDTHS